jgi:energy-coupling factor transporter ATP-binding protein EcfA2
VGPGEIFGFIGPNGAGKTTTIRVMATLLEPMAGRVEIDGVDVTIDPERCARIGYMPDHAGVYERITVREYLEFFADAFCVPSLGVVDAVLELTDLGDPDRIVATMSKGMKQRLQLARILLHDPKVLILDEPASDLDPRARIEIRDLLLELRQPRKDDLPVVAHPHRALRRVHLGRPSWSAGASWSPGRSPRSARASSRSAHASGRGPAPPRCLVGARAGLLPAAAAARAAAEARAAGVLAGSARGAAGRALPTGSRRSTTSTTATRRELGQRSPGSDASADASARYREPMPAPMPAPRGLDATGAPGPRRKVKLRVLGSPDDGGLPLARRARCASPTVTSWEEPCTWATWAVT